MTTALTMPVDPDDLPEDGLTTRLAKRAKDGDREALNDLIARHQGWLRRVVRIKLGGAPRVRQYFDSMDIVQETLAVMMKRIGGLEVRSAAAVRQWLAKIAAYEIKDAIKYTKAGKRDADEVPFGSPHGRTSQLGVQPEASGTRPDDRAWKHELADILDEAVSQLPDDYQEVILLRDYAKEDWEPIRAHLDRPTVRAAMQLYQRAWIKIRDIAGPRLAPPSSE